MTINSQEAEVKVMPYEIDIKNRLIVFSMSLSFLICMIATYLFRDYTLDDALIYYRYIQNALNGNGLVYNIGEKFNGLTSPLYTYFSLLVSWVGGDIIKNQIYIGGLFLFLSALVSAILFGEKKVIACSLPLFIVSSRYFYLTFGLESTLLLFLVLLSLWLYDLHQYRYLGIVCAALLLVRGESLFLMIVLTLRHIWDRRPFPPFSFFAVPIMILIIQFTFSYFYYESFLPNTLAAKFYQGQSGLWGKWPFLKVLYFSEMTFNNNPYLMAGFGLIVLMGFIVGLKDRRYLTLFIFTLLISLFYLILRIPYYHWYYIFHWITIYMSAAFGLSLLFRFCFMLVNKYFRLISIVTTLIFFFFLVSGQFSLLLNKELISNERSGYAPVGRWLEKNTSKQSSIACVEIGHIGWYSKRKIIDILGLVTPMNAQFLGQRNFSAWLNHYYPDYILIHNPVWGHEQSVVKLIENGSYVPVEDFNFRGYVLIKRKI